MTVLRLQQADVCVRVVEALGLDTQTVGLSSAEAICASLRRAASLLCPASPRQLVDGVWDVLHPLEASLERETVIELLDALVGLGDLLEVKDEAVRRRLLFLAPPSYVEKQPGEVLLLGIRPDNAKVISDDMIDFEIFYESHTRWLIADPVNVREIIENAGLHRVSLEHWARAPRAETPADALEGIRHAPGWMSAGGNIDGLSMIDPAAAVHFYKGRWREPRTSDTGLFVGRRPQAYGAPLWCVVEFVAGTPKQVLDLPLQQTVVPGWDEARRTQAAIDTVRGTPQVYRVRKLQANDAVLDFFGPLPSWAERYLALFGLPVAKGQGALFSYRLANAVLEPTQQFLSQYLWMTDLKEQ